MDGTPLVTLDGAAVVREPSGWCWLGEVADGGGTGLEDHRPGVYGTDVATTVAGGLTPAGTVRVRVRDRGGREHDAVVGAGAWIVRLPQPVRGESPVVRHEDGAGDVVPVRVPEGVALTPVADATVACPVCAAVDWGRVDAAPDGRYGEDGAGRPTAALCRRCGYEEHLGVLYATTGDADGSGAEAAGGLRALLGEFDARFGPVVDDAPFAPYRVAGRAAAPASCGSSGDVIVSVAVAYEDVTVTTGADPYAEPPEWEARSRLEGLLHERDPDWPDASPAAVLLWLAARDRVHAADAHGAGARELKLPVDGVATPFACVARDGWFAAAARIGSLTVTVAGQGDPDGLALTSD